MNPTLSHPPLPGGEAGPESHPVVAHIRQEWAAVVSGDTEGASRLQHSLRRIDDKNRPEIWCAVSDADRQSFTPAQFRLAFQELLKRADAELSEKTKYQISIDVPRSHEGLDEGQRQKLHQVLLATAVLKSEVGYTQGINFLAVVVLKSLCWDMPRAVAVLANVINRCAVDYFEATLVGARIDIRVLEQLMEAHLPQVHEQLVKHGMPVDWVVTDTIISLFVHKLPLETVQKLWDLMLILDPAVFLFAALMAFFSLHQSMVLECTSLDGLMDTLKLCLDTWARGCNEEALIREVLRLARRLDVSVIQNMRSAVRAEMQSPSSIGESFASDLRSSCSTEVEEAAATVLLQKLMSSLRLKQEITGIVHVLRVGGIRMCHATRGLRAKAVAAGDAMLAQAETSIADISKSLQSVSGQPHDLRAVASYAGNSSMVMSMGEDCIAEEFLLFRLMVEVDEVLRLACIVPEQSPDESVLSATNVFRDRLATAAAGVPAARYANTLCQLISSLGSTAIGRGSIPSAAAAANKSLGVSSPGQQGLRALTRFRRKLQLIPDHLLAAPLDGADGVEAEHKQPEIARRSDEDLDSIARVLDSTGCRPHIVALLMVMKLLRENQRAHVLDGCSATVRHVVLGSLNSLRLQLHNWLSHAMTVRQWRAFEPHLAAVMSEWEQEGVEASLAGFGATAVKAEYVFYDAMRRNHRAWSQIGALCRDLESVRPQTISDAVSHCEAISYEEARRLERERKNIDLALTLLQGIISDIKALRAEIQPPASEAAQIHSANVISAAPPAVVARAPTIQQVTAVEGEQKIQTAAVIRAPMANAPVLMCPGSARQRIAALRHRLTTFMSRIATMRSQMWKEQLQSAAQLRLAQLGDLEQSLPA